MESLFVGDREIEVVGEYLFVFVEFVGVLCGVVEDFDLLGGDVCVVGFVDVVGEEWVE